MGSEQHASRTTCQKAPRGTEAPRGRSMVPGLQTCLHPAGMQHLGPRWRSQAAFAVTLSQVPPIPARGESNEAAARREPKLMQASRAGQQ